MMETNKFNTPILFLIFNRPDTTFKVFEEIRKIKPAKLYIAADGPRPNVIGEEEKCTASRNIIKQVDWDCDVKTLFREKNLGCKIAVSSAISWFFENVEEGIILEDDTFPTQSFFWFCQELLDFYRNDSRIMHISGNNFQLGKIRGEGSYYFSKYNHIWGWATWKRAWRFYDVSLNTFPIFVQRKVIKNIFRRVKVQCLTARENTERPVTVEVGTNQLMGIDWQKIKDVALKILSGNNKKGNIPELWDGKASERIVEILISKI